MGRKAKATVALVLALALFAGCANAEEFDPDNEIALNSREGGSGTRSAFVELFDIREAVGGELFDAISLEAAITNNTSVMMMSVSGDRYGIGYISLGSLNDSVKPLRIDGAEPTAENIANGSYAIARPFNIATRPELSAAAADFVAFILSDEGQGIVESAGYVPLTGTGAYAPKNLSARVVVAGSSSVNPVMERLKEAYARLNPNTTIELQQSDSSTGINATAEGIADIGMASRELTESELLRGLRSTVIAFDGIVVIVNRSNPLAELSSDQVKQIFAGEITSWSRLVD